MLLHVGEYIKAFASGANPAASDMPVPSANASAAVLKIVFDVLINIPLKPG
jgi:hypothetical protein